MEEFKGFLEGVQLGLGDVFTQVLWDNNIRSAGVLAAAEPDDLVHHGIDKAVARAIIKKAKDVAGPWAACPSAPPFTHLVYFSLNGQVEKVTVKQDGKVPLPYWASATLVVESVKLEEIGGLFDPATRTTTYPFLELAGLFEEGKGTADKPIAVTGIEREIAPHRDGVLARDQLDQIIHIRAVVDKLDAMAKTKHASTTGSWSGCAPYAPDDVEILGLRLARWLNGIFDQHEKKSI